MKLSIYNKIVPIENNISLIYNSISGAYILINNTIANCINNKDIDTLLTNHNSFINELKENNIIVDENVDERELVENVRLVRRFNSHVYNLTINPTLDCNLNCWYCYETHNNTNNMRNDLIKKILNHLKVQHKISNYDSLSLAFFGGEPLLKKDLIVSIYKLVREYCEKERIKLSIEFTTNGTLLTNEFLREFKDVHTLFQITLDGNKARHNKVRNYKNSKVGSYSKIIEKIKMLTRILTDYKLIVRINFDGKTLADISDILEDIKNFPKEYTEISPHRVWQVDDTDINYQQLFDFIHKANEIGFVVNYFPLRSMITHCCYADNINQAVINYDGNVFKCTARNFSPDNREGYLSDDGNIIWSVSKLMKRLSTTAPNTCRECVIYPSCYGTCSQNLLESKGSENCRMSSGIDIDDIIRINFSQILVRVC